MLGGTKITDTLKGDILQGYLDNCCPQRGILLPLLCCLDIDEVIEGLEGKGCFKIGYVLQSSAENSQSDSQLLLEALSMNKSGVVKIS